MDIYTVTKHKDKLYNNLSGYQDSKAPKEATFFTN